MRIDFTNEEYGIEFVTEHEYESLPSIRFNGDDRLHIGLVDDDMAVELRDLLLDRFPTDERAGLTDTMAATLSDLAEDALGTIRAAEAMGNQPLYQKWRSEYATIVRVADALGVDISAGHDGKE
ncbi:MAG: hypothetical protein E7H36_10495 [Bifidobacterium dentium]|nr:hypothetical protein [Bifidobacterium dentium]